MQMNFLAKNANAKLQKVCRLKQKRMGTQAVFCVQNPACSPMTKKAASKNHFDAAKHCV